MCVCVVSTTFQSSAGSVGSLAQYRQVLFEGLLELSVIIVYISFRYGVLRPYSIGYDPTYAVPDQLVTEHEIGWITVESMQSSGGRNTPVRFIRHWVEQLVCESTLLSSYISDLIIFSLESKHVLPSCSKSLFRFVVLWRYSRSFESDRAESALNMRDVIDLASLRIRRCFEAVFKSRRGRVSGMKDYTVYCGNRNARRHVIQQSTVFMIGVKHRGWYRVRSKRENSTATRGTAAEFNNTAYGPGTV